jgi:hypothetical protein
MSIKPGVTTMEEATTLLSASDQFDRESIEITEYGIAVKWHMGATSASFTTWVRIYASDNGADVKSITFVGLDPYTVEDFIDFLGEPDEIFIIIRNAPHGRYLDYALHYPSLNTFFYANPREKMIGPDPGDHIEKMYLDTNLDDENLEPWIIIDNGNRQPWLGYGHLDEYLPNVKLPDSQ